MLHEGPDRELPEHLLGLGTVLLHARGQRVPVLWTRGGHFAGRERMLSATCSRWGVLGCDDWLTGPLD